MTAQESLCSLGDIQSKLLLHQPGLDRAGILAAVARVEDHEGEWAFGRGRRNVDRRRGSGGEVVAARRTIPPSTADQPRPEDGRGTSPVAVTLRTSSGNLVAQRGSDFGFGQRAIPDGGSCRCVPEWPLRRPLRAIALFARPQSCRAEEAPSPRRLPARGDRRSRPPSPTFNARSKVAPAECSARRNASMSSVDWRVPLITPKSWRVWAKLAPLVAMAPSYSKRRNKSVSWLAPISAKSRRAR